MKKKEVMAVFGAVVLALSGSLMTGCGKNDDTQEEIVETTDESTLLIQETPEIEIIVSTPESIEQGTPIPIVWTEVGNLETNSDLRTAFDDIFNVTGGTGEKQGWVYTSQNITLQDAINNDETILVLYGTGNPATQTLADTAGLSYIDTDGLDVQEQIAMALNGYFNLLPDNEPGYSNPYQTLTRAQAMAMLMRSTTPVKEISSDNDFVEAVGESEYNIYAQELDRSAYINTVDGSLTQTTYNGTMTRAEAVYMIVQRFFSDDYDNKTYGADLSDAIETSVSEDDNTNTVSKALLLNDMLTNPDNGLSHELYKALQVAYDHNLIDSETRWNEGITKSEFIDILVRALSETYLSGSTLGVEYTAPEQTAGTAGGSMTGVANIEPGAEERELAKSLEERGYTIIWDNETGLFEAIPPQEEQQQQSGQQSSQPAGQQSSEAQQPVVQPQPNTQANSEEHIAGNEDWGKSVTIDGITITFGVPSGASLDDIENHWYD